MIARWIGYFFLALAFLVLSPVILLIGVLEWIRIWRRGPWPNPFLPEDPASAGAWAEKMERGRRLQAEEERDG